MRTGKPDILVGNSNGSFLAQIVAAQNKIPALLGNPYFEMTRFLIERIGSHEYKSPRANGNQQLVIDQALIDEFAGLQQHQWDYCQTASQKNIWGIFGENDHLAHFEPLFLKHYKYAYHFRVVTHQRLKKCGRIMLRWLKSYWAYNGISI